MNPMATFILLPETKEILNLDAIAAVLPAPPQIPSDEYGIEIQLIGDPDPVEYGGDDGKKILTALAAQLKISLADLVEQLGEADSDDQ